MRHAFGYIFWGMVVLLIHFNFDGIPILPSGLGYLLIAVGASKLADQSGKVCPACGLSVLLAVMWLVGLIISRDLEVPYYLVSGLLNVAMYWCLLGGIIDIALTHNRADLAQRAINRRIAYAIVMAIGMLMTLAAANSLGVDGSIVLVAVIAGLVVAVMIIHLVYRVRNELA